jgi:hypothetical protein
MSGVGGHHGHRGQTAGKRSSSNDLNRLPVHTRGHVAVGASDLRFRLTALLSTGFQLTLPLDDSERDPLARRSA